MFSRWNSKKECRAFYKTLLNKEFTQGFVQNSSLQKSLAHFLSAEQGLWATYKALPQEADVEGVSVPAGLQWAYPRMENGHLQFCHGTEFVQGPYGIWEPGPSCQPVQLKDLVGVLVPGLAFSKWGDRLGKGKGFYDKALAGFHGKKVGICFDLQIVERPFPVDDHDVQMDFIVTESEVFECRKWTRQS
jgi:5-formyltetrahydrofolate cyclo-ligase